MSNENRPSLGFVIVDRRGFARFLKGAAATVLGLGMSSSERRQSAPQVEPPTAPSETPLPVVTPEPSKIPVPTAGEVHTQTAAVVVEAPTATPPPIVTEAPTVPPRIETPKPTEVPIISRPSFELSNEFMMSLQYGSGGGILQSPTPEGGGGSSGIEPQSDPREFASTMWGKEVDYFPTNSVGRMLGGISIAVQIGLPENGPTTYRPFEPEDVRFFAAKLNAPEVPQGGIKVEVLDSNGEVKEIDIKKGSDIIVTGMTELNGVKCIVFSYDDYENREEQEGVPKGFIAVVPVEAFKEQIAPLANIEYDENGDGTVTFKFRDENDQRNTWVPNEIKEDYKNSILEWMKNLEEPPALPNVEWSISEIKEEQERTGKILAFWAKFGGKAEEATRLDGRTVLLLTEIPGDTEVPLPISGPIMFEVGATTGTKMLDVTVSPGKTFVIAFSPATSVLLPGSGGPTGEVGTPMARVAGASMDLDTFSIFSKQAQILVGAYNPQTYELLSVGLSDILKDKEDRVVVIAS